MAANQLAVYNLALVEALGEEPLVSGEDSTTKRTLDAVWTAGNGFVRACLEQGYWAFAMRAISLDSSASVDPAFGLSFAFAEPTDMVRLNQISADEFFTTPLNRYERERGYIYADVDPLYLRYVSDDGSFGGDMSLWPESFLRWVAHDLALRVAPKVKSATNIAELRKDANKFLVDARSKDAQQQPTRFPPQGSWVRARLGSNRRNRDGGSRSTLIG